MTDEELIAWLRRQGWEKDIAAADRIEALVKELNTCRMAQAVMDNTVADLEAKLAKAVEALGLADDALYEAEAILGGEYGDHYGPLCEMMVKLRAKIAEIKSGVATTPYGLEGESHD